jgi:PKD repeat protein
LLSAVAASAVLICAASAAMAMQFDSLATSPCAADATTLCLNANRFKVQAHWQALNLIPIQSGEGQAVPLTGDTGYFWFFGASNIELVIKAVDGRPVNSRLWVFYGALSNVQYVIAVTDTQTGAVQKYFNIQNHQASVGDTVAFSDTFAGGPSANFSLSTATPAAGASAFFTDTSTGNPTQWVWDFGDNTAFDTRQNPTHVFAQPGEYTVALTVRNGDSSADHSEAVTVGPAGTQPVASFSVSSSPTSGAAVAFQDTSTNSPDAWLWDFGDPGSGASNTSTLQNPTHTFAAAETYTVTELSSNNSGTSAPATRQVVVAPGVPAVTTIVVDVESFTFNHGDPIVVHVGQSYKLKFHTLDNGSSRQGHGFSGAAEFGLSSHRPLLVGPDYTTETFTPTSGQIGSHFFDCNAVVECGSGHSTMSIPIVVQP